MSKWSFFGKVHPERVPVTWHGPLKGSLQQTDFGLEYDFSVVIHASQIIVDLTITKGATDVESLRNVALDAARQLTDIVGYTCGCYFDVEIISARNRDNDEWRVFGVEIPILATNSNSHRSREIPGDLFLAAAQSVSAGMALRDFQLSMRDAIGTGFYCYRAVEAMMQSMKLHTDKRDKEVWERFNACLMLDRSVSDMVKTHANFPRHGKPSSMTDKDRCEVFRLTDEIIHRFLEHLRRDACLSAAEFPLLTAST